jgi:apolipoprotein N-acyltransferase
LYEFILFFVNVNWFNSNFEQIDKLVANNGGTQSSYYYFLYVLNKFVYWVYELLHTFFVTVAQFVAFFAMVFWLFLFLYTMFVVEEFEKYLDAKRSKFKNK